MKEVALITGASGGIGLEIAKLFALKKIPLVLVARNDTKLQEVRDHLEKSYGADVLICCEDLSLHDSAQPVWQFCKKHDVFVKYLVNNAGFGDYGNFTERSFEKYREMIGLNIATLTELTHLFAKEMVKRGAGKIMNVASVAGLQPDPRFAVYGASKAYVISLSEALAKELEGTGVSCTVLSPGVTKTGFMQRAAMSNARIYQSGVMEAAEVARTGFEGMMKGKLHVIPGLKNRILGFFSSITPSGKFRLAIAAKIMEETKQ